MNWCAGPWRPQPVVNVSHDITLRARATVAQKAFIPKLGHRKAVLKAIAKNAAGGGSATSESAAATPAAAAGLGAEAVSVSVPTGGGEDTPYTYVLLLRARVWGGHG